MYTCQKDKEQPHAVKKYELNKQNNTNKSLCVINHDLVHDKVEHGVEVDGDEANWNTNDVMEIINGNKITTGLIANNDIYYFNTKNQNFVEEQQFWSQNHEFEIFG